MLPKLKDTLTRMDLGLEGKVVFVTGASRGLGCSIAVAFHREGCRVALNARQEEPLARLCASLGERVMSVPGDVTDQQVAQDLIGSVEKEWGRLDVVVCNVGSGRSVSPGQESLSEWERVMRLNLYGATNVVEAATEILAMTGGAVICISSICGLEALGAPVTYSAAKAALNSYVHGIARPLGRRGIRINAVAPGNLLFEGSVWEQKLAQDPQGVQEMLNREVALQRLGQPEEIAHFVTFLASPRASFASGAVFVVDGGQTRS